MLETLRIQGMKAHLPRAASNVAYLLDKLLVIRVIYVLDSTSQHKDVNKVLQESIQGKSELTSYVTYHT